MADRNINTINVVVVKDSGGFYGATGISKQISCDHANYGVEQLSASVTDTGCGTKVGAQTVFPVANYLGASTVETVKLKPRAEDAAIWVLKTSYDAAKATCNGCCGS